MTAEILISALLLAHFLLDYPLQGDFLARAKSRHAPLPEVPWSQAMFAHAAMHGLAVHLITGVPLLGLAEFVVHALLDDAKCAGRIGFHTDQLAHIICKLLWAAIALGVLR